MLTGPEFLKAGETIKQAVGFVDNHMRLATLPPSIEFNHMGLENLSSLMLPNEVIGEFIASAIFIMATIISLKELRNPGAAVITGVGAAGFTFHALYLLATN